MYKARNNNNNNNNNNKHMDLRLSFLYERSDDTTKKTGAVLVKKKNK